MDPSWSEAEGARLDACIGLVRILRIGVKKNVCRKGEGRGGGGSHPAPLAATSCFFAFMAGAPLFLLPFVTAAASPLATRPSSTAFFRKRLRRLEMAMPLTAPPGGIG